MIPSSIATERTERCRRCTAISPRIVSSVRTSPASENQRRSLGSAPSCRMNDTATFEAVINRLQTPQEAFFEQRIEIAGDMDTALKLAVLFSQFLCESPAPLLHHKEAMDSTLSHS